MPGATDEGRAERPGFGTSRVDHVVGRRSSPNGDQITEIRDDDEGKAERRRGGADGVRRGPVRVPPKVLPRGVGGLGQPGEGAFSRPRRRRDPQHKQPVLLKDVLPSVRNAAEQ